MAYKTGERYQTTFFPATVDEYVTAEDPVRVYDAFIDALDFQGLGISVEPFKSGAHEYCPKSMLKLIVYGYSYGKRSSRKLERACHHNLSFIWLMGGLRPDYRTIARFRSENKEAIKNVLKQCVHMCVELDLIEGNILFVDGSCFRANASIKNTWTKERCKKHLEEISKRIDDLVEEAEQTDNAENNHGSLVKVREELRDQEALKKKVQKIASDLKAAARKSINTTDIDCAKVNCGSIRAGYNAQIVADEKNGLIVTSEATNRSEDANQFNEQVTNAIEVLKKKPKAAVADAGYYSLADLEKVDKEIMIVVPSQKQVWRGKAGVEVKPFGKEEFRYDEQKNEYICPAGKRLKRYACSADKRRIYYKARAHDCGNCEHYGVCTKAKSRLVTRMKEEELQEKLNKMYNTREGQDIYGLRKQKVELPFGHMKRNLQAGQFMLRGKNGASAELSILSVCFNLARMITLIGIPELILRLKGA